jgi:hypothetical protein
MLRSAIAVLVALAAPLSAQDSKKITFRTLCLTHVDGVKMLYLPGDEPGQFTEAPLFREVFSLPAEATVKGGKASFLLSKDAPAPGKPPAALPAVAIPGSSKILFLFLPNPGKKEAPYQIVAMPDDESSFPLGTTKTINLTPANLRFELGEQSIEVAPGKTTIIPAVKKVNHLNQFDAKVSYEIKPDEFVVFYNTRWRSVAAKRDIAVAFVEPTTKKPTVNLYEDAPPAPLPPP